MAPKLKEVEAAALSLPAQERAQLATRLVASREGGLRRFVRFFRGYINGLSLVVAALPLPLAKLELIPSFRTLIPMAPTYTSIFCFLIIALVYGSRHMLARRTYLQDANGTRDGHFTIVLSAALILGAFACGLMYYHTLVASAGFIMTKYGTPTFDRALNAGPQDIPDPILLVALYVGFFVFAASALVVMGLREYMQEALGISDRDLILRVGA